MLIKVVLHVLQVAKYVLPSVTAQPAKVVWSLMPTVHAHILLIIAAVDTTSIRWEIVPNVSLPVTLVTVELLPTVSLALADTPYTTVFVFKTVIRLLTTQSI